MSACRHPAISRAIVNRRASNGYRSVRRVCQRCGTLLSLGDSNDNIPAREKRLAAVLLDIYQLWERGKSRDKLVDIVVDKSCREPQGQR
jgi:hypothetical protein